MTTGLVFVRRSHAWQNSFVWASFIVGVLHILGAMIPNWDPSVALSELPWWESAIVGIMMLGGGVLARMSLCKERGQLERWQLEHAALRLLFLTWLVQGVVGLVSDIDRIIPWVVYLAIAHGFYRRLGQSKQDREEALFSQEGEDS